MTEKVARDLLLKTFEEALAAKSFKDYGPNGLQVEGCESIERIISGVTASQALIDAAIMRRADAILVHHGLFWRGMDGCLTGWLKRRVNALMANNINLFAYHLPLDAHVVLGNNAQLGLRMGWGYGKPFESEPLLFHAVVNYSSGKLLLRHLQTKLCRPVTSIIDPEKPIQRLSWCSGGAQGFFQQAIDAGMDAYITGEISEPQAHLASETQVGFIAAGHHATERYGVQALGNYVAEKFGLEHEFIDIDNPA